MLMIGLSFCFVAGAEAADLIVSPAALSFGLTGGATLAIPQQFDVNSTAGPLTFTVSSSSAGNWLTVIGSTPLANGSWEAATPFSVSVFVNATGLNPGNYRGTITVSAASAANSPQTVTVSLSVGSPPAIAANPASISFTAQSGDSRSATKSIAVSISQPSQSDFTATAVGGDWVSVNYLSGTLPGTINAVVNPVGLAPGSYSASIFISIVGASKQSVDRACRADSCQSHPSLHHGADSGLRDGRRNGLDVDRERHGNSFGRHSTMERVVASNQICQRLAINSFRTGQSYCRAGQRQYYNSAPRHAIVGRFPLSHHRCIPSRDQSERNRTDL